MSVRVLVVDDHDIVREGLSRSLQEEENFDVVGEAADGQAAIDMVQTAVPDVILMDISMPKMDGFVATERILAKTPNVKVIALSMHGARWFVDKMLKSGASGYVMKDCDNDELREAIETVLDGRIYISPLTGYVETQC